ncbi:hypothetical protein ACFOWX_02060 [Sphingorhabdus arenilitoris]|uniref:Argininosuccinate lyase n=1 Tax=Sphingorhabdus arenilitoris TaxID=1490041 RepID=A0ABV8RCW6_9SPHN
MKLALPLTPRLCAFAALLVLAGCGKYGELEPQPGSKSLPVAYGQEKAETPDELLTPSPQARPGRSAEILSRSQRREDDPFDLPPGSEPEVDGPSAGDTAEPKETVAQPGSEDEPKYKTP